MASSSSDRDRPDGKDQQTNPFIAFRHFADAQMSSLVNGVFGIFESSPIRRQRAIEKYEAMLRKSREMDTDLSTPPSTTGQEAKRAEVYNKRYKGVSSQTMADRHTNPVGGDEWDRDDERLPYGDDDDDEYLLNGEGCLDYSSFAAARNQGLGDWVPDMPTFGITYLYTSPYSPVYLELEERFQKHAGKFRAAFADLLAYQDDEKLLDGNVVQTSAQMTPSDWLADMTGMIIFGKGIRTYSWDNFDAFQLNRLLLASHMRDMLRAGKDEECPCRPDNPWQTWVNLGFCDLARQAFGLERDLENEEQAEDEQSSTQSQTISPFWNESLDQFEEDQRSEKFRRWREQFRQWREEENEEQQARDSDNGETSTSELDLYHALVGPQTDQEDPPYVQVEAQARIDNKPSILSTLTTTEKRTLPDGSVTTKVVLKKRFSDGAQEVTENFHTQNAPLPQKPTNAGSTKKEESASQGSKGEKRSGWFWS